MCFYDDGILMCRSSVCIAKSQSDDPDIPKRTISRFGCRNCFDAADDTEQLARKIEMVKRLDLLELTEAKAVGKPGSIGEFHTTLLDRSYVQVPRDCPFIQPTTERDLMALVNMPLNESISLLLSRLSSVGHKNDALELLCKTRVAYLASRPRADDGQDHGDYHGQSATQNQTKANQAVY